MVLRSWMIYFKLSPYIIKKRTLEINKNIINEAPYFGEFKTMPE